MDILCPICGKTLSHQERVCRCEAGHSFDIARQGYINLLPVQQKHSRNPGDTREQVLARRQFLEAGFYAPIARALSEAARRYGGQVEGEHKNYLPGMDRCPDGSLFNH